MRGRRMVPLMVKTAGWLAVHLGVLVVVFFLFVRWQLGLGLDSLLSNSAKERLALLGERIAGDLEGSRPDEWEEIIRGRVSVYGVKACFPETEGPGPGRMGVAIPPSVMEKVRLGRPLPPPPPRSRFRSGGGPDQPVPPLPPRNEVAGDGGAKAEVLFLGKDREAGAYWAAIKLEIIGVSGIRPHHRVLFLRSESASAGGLFFDYRPLLIGGVFVFVVSVGLWTPFVFGITRYARRISDTAERIAHGEFDARIGATRNDELGLAGASIERMAGQLGNLVHGQKRFLGDVAHELCAPLARMRTGLGVLGNSKDIERHVRSIDEDAQELSDLISELLAFTKANAAAVVPEEISVREWVGRLAERELPGHEVSLRIDEGFSVWADRRLLTRALLNLLRNCKRHAGPGCRVMITGKAGAGEGVITVEDDGPGVRDENLDRLFEPFFRTDRSRSRDTGGTGLGLAIVESSIRACEGKVVAARSALGGLSVALTLPLAERS